jgi:hypothetical protein
MNCYNAITNSYCDDNEVIEPVTPRIPPVLFNWSNTAKFSEVYTVQQEQNDQLASLHTEQGVQNDAIDVLQSGFLPRVYYDETGLGGSHLLFTPAQEYTDVTTGQTGLIPSSAKLETYDTAGTIASAITLQGDLVTLEGILELGTTPDVESLLLEHTTKIHNLEIEGAVTTAAELAVEAALAALEAASFLKPPGYAPIEEVPPGETDPNSTSVDPLTLAPSGTFQGVDALGAITHTTVARGKVGINNTFPLRSLDLKGDIRQQPTDAQDTVEFESTCSLGSKVAVYNASNMLSNPQSVVVRMGTNALVQTDGTLNAAAINTDSVNTASVNGLATNKLIQRYQPTTDLSVSKRAAKAVTSALQANRAIKPTIPSRNYSDDLLRIHDEVLLVKRAFRPPMLSKNYDEPIVGLHAEVLSVKRGAYTKPVMLTRNPDLAITRLRSDVNSVKHAANRVVLTKSADLAITRLRSDVNSVKHSANRVVLAKSADLAITRLRSDVNSVKHTANRVVLAKSADMAITRLRTDVNSVKHSANKVTLAPDFSSKISAVKSYTASISTSTAAALKVVGTLGVTGTSTLAGISATSLGVTGTSTLAATTATTLGVSGNTLQLASATSNSAVFDQGGLLVGTGSSQAKLTYDNASTSWVSNKGLTVPSLVVTGAISNSVSSVTTTFQGPTSSTYETWINVGSFTDSFTGTVTITLDNTDPKLCDCLDINICYNRSGLTPVVTANKSGNLNSISYYGFSAVSLSNYALDASGQVHTLYVGYGTIPDGKTFTAAYILRAGNFTLSKPLTYTNPNTSTGFVGPRYDPTYSCINCVTGTNNALVTNLLNGQVNIANAIADRIQVSQLTGKVQSILNPAVNSYFTLGTFRNQFSGHVRIVLTTSAQIANATQVIDLAVNYCQGQSTSSVVVNNAPSPGVTSAPSIGISTAYITSGGDLVLKGPSVACNLYWTALNSDGYVDSQGNGNDGWDESTQAVSTTVPTGQVINLSNLGNTGFANGVDIAGTLNHTGSVANLCQVNTGNYIECSAGGGTAYIDLHAGANTDNTDYDARILASNKNISLSAANGVTVTAGPLNFGRLGQLINTFGTSYGMGIQGNTQYYRSAMNHTWYVGGTHSDTQGDSGGGNTVFSLNGSTYEAYLRGGTGNYTSVVRSSKNIVLSGNVGAASQSTGTIQFGITFTSPPVVCLTINDAGGTVAAIYVAGVSTTQCSWSASNSGTSNRTVNWIVNGSSTQ